MPWNYRVLRHNDGSLAIHEVYYGPDGSPQSVTVSPATFGTDFGDDHAARIEDLRGSLNRAMGALDKPILDLSTFRRKPA